MDVHVDQPGPGLTGRVRLSQPKARLLHRAPHRDLCRCQRAAGVGRIATVVGRFFAMDRDKRWDRVQRAYDLFTRGAAVLGTYTDGGTVFTTGCTEWSRGLEGRDPHVMRITTNVLDRLST